MEDREQQLKKLKEGDIFHASSEYSPSLICFITSIDEENIFARCVTLQIDFQFNRKTGLAKDKDDARCKIDSLAPLPVEIYEALVQLDQQYQSLNSDPIFSSMSSNEKFNSEEFLSKLKLKKNEIDALLFVGKYYSENKLID